VFRFGSKIEPLVAPNRKNRIGWSVRGEWNRTTKIEPLGEPEPNQTGNFEKILNPALDLNRLKFKKV